MVTPTEMAAIDAEAPEPIDELIERAGWATARAVLELLDQPYGSRVVILAGKGNNGADGRAAVPHLRRAGVHCRIVDVGGESSASDAAGEEASTGPATARRRAERPALIVDACYGTGLRRPFDARTLPIEIGDTPVLAVDVPSGVDGATGELRDHPLRATATVTFAALKPGLVLEPGRSFVGRLTVADIGLDCSRATIHHLEADDLRRWPARPVDGHKWRRAVAVVGGGPGMTGATGLAALGALRAGAGYATISRPGSALGAIPGVGAGPGPSGRVGAGSVGAASVGAGPVGAGSIDTGSVGAGSVETGSVGAGSVDAGPIEAVAYPVGERWADELADRLGRFGAAVVGPGLADQASNHREVGRWWSEAPIPTVFDAGALTALAAIGPPWPPPGAAHVLTPHEGELTRLLGRPPGTDRIAEARSLAARLGAVVLLKGPTTVVADPGGEVLVSTAGDARLATAGTGDVLSGIVAAGLAAGLTPLLAAGLGAEVHGRSARRGHAVGLVASDLPALVADLLSEVGTGG
ncbi:MAG: NAD(P)H-hydrate dehydratase [Actinomycetota bacterium]